MIDSHAHLAFGEAFNSDRQEVIDRMRGSGVSGWIEVGTDVAQSRRALALAEQYRNSWSTVGVHPADISAGIDWNEIEDLLKHKKVVAVGEVGFDFFRTAEDQKNEVKNQQAEVLERFVGLAQQYDKPMIFHVRDTAGTYDAQAALLEFLQDKKVQGVIHTFSGNADHARVYLELGLCLSFSGVITFKNAGSMVEAAKMVPAGRLLIETDSPFLAPMPHRGERNEPAYVRLVAEKLAEIRGVSFEEIDRVTEENTRRLFGV